MQHCGAVCAVPWGSVRHRTVFFEKDVSYYASTRDDIDIPGCELRLYDRWEDIVVDAIREIDDADVAMVTSYCQDGPQPRGSFSKQGPVSDAFTISTLR